MDFAQMPYAPGGHGFSGHTGEFASERLGMLDAMANVKADILRLRLPVPTARAAVATSPDAVQELLVEKAKSFDKSDMLRFALRGLAGEGLFTSNGELWRKQRKLMAPLFQPKALSGYADAMVACSRRVVDRWGDGATMPLLHETTALTMSIAGKTLFDADTFTEADEIGRALTVALDWAGWAPGRPFSIAHVLTKRALQQLAPRAPTWARGPIAAASARFQGPVMLVGERGRQLRAALDVLDRRVQRMIDDRRAALREGRSVPDLLTRLLEARDETGAAMSDRQVRDEVLTLFVAGHETTATGLAWTLYLACKNPHVYEALEREVDALDGDPTLEDLGRLDLCARAFKEALRIYPPVYMVGRDSREPVTVGGYELPVPTNVFFSPWAMHRSPHVWPEPLRFDPDRFLPRAEASRHRYAWIPFGAGPRVCIGNHFAIMEAQIALAILMRRARFELLGDEVPEPSATLRPREGVRVGVRLREPRRISVPVVA